MEDRKEWGSTVCEADRKESRGVLKVSKGENEDASLPVEEGFVKHDADGADFEVEDGFSGVAGSSKQKREICWQLDEEQSCSISILQLLPSNLLVLETFSVSASLSVSKSRRV